MLFFTPIFLFAFLPIAWLVFKGLEGRTPNWASIIWLLAASWTFYAWALPIHLLWLLGSIAFNYICSIGLARNTASASGKPLLVVGIATNLCLLGAFKYSGFATETVSNLFGLNLTPPALLLPLAISFFTFQQISYLVTTYREQRLIAKPHEYALYVSFFPQLIAGPIVQPGEMIPQLQSERFSKVRLEDFALGATLLIIGLGKKILLADNLAPIADSAFALSSASEGSSALVAWTGLFAFTFQIYFDFSAYSEMALGLALFFGIRLPENFASPYQATSVIDFWRRWHITLSRFFKNYLYIPLGGNRNGVFRKYANILITMTLAGLWHGANWTFLLWGIAHGALLCANHLWRKTPFAIPSALSWGLTFLSVSFAWVLFRAESFSSAALYFQSLAGSFGIYGTDGSSLLEFLRSLEPMEAWKSTHYAIHFLGWYPSVINGVHPGHFIFSEPVLSLMQILFAAILVFAFPRPVAWLANTESGKPAFSIKAAVLSAAIIALIIAQSGSFQSTPFLYFRF